MVKAFFHRLSLGMKHGTVTLNRGQKDSHWNGCFFPEEVQGYPFSREVNGCGFFAIQKG
jgi:hypothetical protein